MTLEHKLQPQFHCLFEKYFIKCHYGGRSAAKSYAYADYVLIRCMQKPGFYLCGREYLISIRDSVHSLMEMRIKQNGWENYFIVKANEITSGNQGKIIYKGIRNDPNQIKGIPNLRLAWIEEAADMTEKSYDIIYHTLLRNKDSELLFTFNPVRDDDFIYQKLVLEKLENALVKKVYYYQNKYLIQEAIDDIEQLKKTNKSKYLHVYEGEPITNYDTLVYRWDSQVNISEKEIHYTAGHETCVTFDFGVGDDTAIIFFHILKVAPNEDNSMGLIIQIFDEYTNNNKPAEHYRDVIESKGYSIDRFFCDPSGHSRDSSLSSWIDKLSFNNRTGRKDWHFEYTHSYSPTEMIDHANEYMPYVRYNPHQVPGVHSMFRKWQYRTDKDDRIILPPKPCHDEYSHYGTSWYYGMINRFKVQKHRQKATVK